MTTSTKLRLLVKARGDALADRKLTLSERKGLGAAASSFTMKAEPLFGSINAARRGGPAAGSEPRWHHVTVDVDAASVNPWQACHDLVSNGIGAAFAEPDLVQRWPVDTGRSLSGALRLREGDQHGQDPQFPRDADNYWFRNSKHSQLASVGNGGVAGQGRRTRIAHLDTGFDPGHSTVPAFLAKDEQRNFVDGDNLANDATDRSEGLLTNFSHGTGTLSILASRQFGCAPDAEVIPIRVASRVVMFANSAIARALDYVHELCRKPQTFVDIVTMSMGGVPSEAWAEAVNALYDAGVFIVTAAGNNYANAPTHLIVYPARFNRVVAACGVMCDGHPYADLNPLLMAGNYGPIEKMQTAIAAYTPNVPWARFGDPQGIDFDGAGTSAATPQVAGAAALWIAQNRAILGKYKEPWMRVESIRGALFASAAPRERQHLGAGRLRVADLLKQPPAQASTLKRAPRDDAKHAVTSLIPGLPVRKDGMALDGLESVHQNMLALELLQILHANGLEQRMTEANGDRRLIADVVDDILARQGLSPALRRALGDRGRAAAGPPASAVSQPAKLVEAHQLKTAMHPELAEPPARRLRLFAYDPSLATDPEMFGINIATVSIRWENDLKPGPVGEYLEVIDVDPASRCCYAPVDLDHPHVLAQNGLQPSEANPQFHQQMAYAVAMRTIDFFERALGRRALWASRYVRDERGNVLESKYVRRLRIYPHAIREENAYYSSSRMALLLGYFRASETTRGTTLPGSRVFGAVSHDIIAHETTHALLDGLHRYYQESTNPDVLAFHEAFADIVALFQHFSMPESLLRQIKRTRGNLANESLLGELAVQFGVASGHGQALRSAIGNVKHGKWRPTSVSRHDYERLTNDSDPHKLGALLVSAVFAAFLQIYRLRSGDLLRLATNGTGVLPEGEIPDVLASRLAAEAGSVARQVLNICIRALDYCPPVDITFGEYLRALITADHDLVPDDDLGYRVAFISAFRDRGIMPMNVEHLAEDSLLWERPALTEELKKSVQSMINQMAEKLQLKWNLDIDRQAAYDQSKANADKVRGWLESAGQALRDALGFEPPAESVEISGLTGELRPIEVHSVRPSRRVSPDGDQLSLLVLQITQTFRAEPDGTRYRGGCTVLIDLNNGPKSGIPRYIIRKRLRGGSGVATQHRWRMAAAVRAAELGLSSAAASGAGHKGETFAMLHRHAREG